MRPGPRQCALRRGTAAAVAAASATLMLGLFAAGCSAAPGTRPATTPAVSSRTLPQPGGEPSVLSPAPVPTSPAPDAAPSSGVTAPPAPAFQATTSVLTSQMRARMTGVSWQPGCPVSLARLRLLRLSYWGFDHLVHQGELIVNQSAAASLTSAFSLLFASRFPIRQMRVVDDFGGDDERSMLADNTSAFNCRLVPDTSVWSQHAFGLAVDLNPFENPEVSNGKVDPPAAAAWADRTRSSPAMIAHGDAAWRAFAAVGWIWGGDWSSLKDYQHFSANGS